MPSNYLRLICLYIIPLIPSIALHLIFENSSAQFDYKNVASFGGPVATYIFLVVFGTKVLTEKKNDLVSDAGKSIKGDWTVKATFIDDDENKKTITSSALIRINNESVSVSGEWSDGQEEGNSGHWCAEEVMFNDKKMILIFTCPTPQGEAYSGIMHLAMNSPSDNGVKKMMGNWGVVGMCKRGMCEWERREAA